MQNNKNTQKTIVSFFFIIIIILVFFFIKKITLSNNFSPSFFRTTVEKSKLKEDTKKVVFLLFKKEKKLELWLKSDTGTILIKHYDIIINNNQLGPKISNNTTNFPEGAYFVTKNDNNNLIIDFPNKFDKNKAIADNRVLKKENILFGKSLNDNGFSLKKTKLAAIYQLIKTENIHDIQLISAPIDFRKNTFLPYCNHCPHWVNELYGQLELELKRVGNK